MRRPRDVVKALLRALVDVVELQLISPDLQMQIDVREEVKLE